VRLGRLAPALALLAVACTRAAPRAGGGGGPGARAAGGTAAATSVAGRPAFSLPTGGAPSSLRFEGGTLVFCDQRGPMKLDLATGHTSPGRGGTCPATPAEPNTACAGLPLVMDVRAPPSETTDILDLDGWSVPVDGRVHDCAGDGQTLAVATGSAILLIDGVHRTTKKMSSDGGDRVSVGLGWIAWSNATQLHLTRIAATPPDPRADRPR
jgi:hypothetical protein